MNRRVATVLGCLLMGILQAASATGQPTSPDGTPTVVVNPYCGVGDSGKSGVCGAEVVRTYERTSKSMPYEVPAPTAPSSRYVPYARIDTGSDGQPCTTTGWREVTNPNVPDSVYQ